MKIPEIRDRLKEFSNIHGIGELSILAEELTRRSAPKRARTTSARMNAKLAEAIRAYAAAHTSLPQARIAEVFNVNPGGVSEALRGKRS